MQNFATSLKEMIASLWCNRTLIKALVRREVVGRCRGSAFGFLWSVKLENT
jgi:lipopolysaccharide transport system permease protein